MQTYLSKHWHRFPEEVWDYFECMLSNEENPEKLPKDVFIELARPAYEEWLREKREKYEGELRNIEEGIIRKTVDVEWSTPSDLFAGYDEIELKKLKSFEAKVRAKYNNLEDNDILTNEKSAKIFLYNWHKQKEISEEFSVKILIQWYEIIKDLYSEMPAYIDFYPKRLSIFFESRNLRYLLLRDKGNIKILFNPAVIFMEKIFTLKNCCNRDPSLKIYYEDYENDVSNLMEDLSDSRKRSVLRVSSNLLEGSAKYSINKKGKSLSSIIKKAPENIFPHPSVKDAILSVYSFYSDYIGGRHSGTNASRKLEEKDAILFGSLSALFSEYLLNNK